MYAGEGSRNGCRMICEKKKICLEKAGESAASQALLYISVGFEF